MLHHIILFIAYICDCIHSPTTKTAFVGLVYFNRVCLFFQERMRRVDDRMFTAYDFTD
jgi:hypothetical protein